jgi:hypothetical protein
MPVHYFNPPGRGDQLQPALDEFVAAIEGNDEEIVGTHPYGTLTAIFTRKLSTGTLTYVSGGDVPRSSKLAVGTKGAETFAPPPAGPAPKLAQRKPKGGAR